VNKQTYNTLQKICRPIALAAAKRFQFSHLSADDWMQEAWIALIKAMKMYKQDNKGDKIDRYCRTAIKHRLQNIARDEIRDLKRRSIYEDEQMNRSIEIQFEKFLHVQHMIANELTDEEFELLESAIDSRPLAAPTPKALRKAKQRRKQATNFLLHKLVNA